MLGGRDGLDAFPDAGGIYGGAWQGAVFVLTHHPEDAPPADGVTFLSCDVAEAVRIGLEAAGGKNLEVFSPSIGRQLLERGLIDEIDLHIAPVLLGDGIRLFDNPGGAPVRLELLNGDDPTAAVNVRYRPATTDPSQSVRSRLTSSGRSCWIQWPQPSRRWEETQAGQGGGVGLDRVGQPGGGGVQGAADEQGRLGDRGAVRRRRGPPSPGPCSR